MRNLAGNPSSDEIIKSELTRCGIPVVKLSDSPTSEVKYTVGGKLDTKYGPFTFVRAWYYYIVTGKVPIEIAKKLYDDPVGKVDIRVRGDCCSPAPEGSHITIENKQGKVLITKDNMLEIQQWVIRDPTYLRLFEKCAYIETCPESERFSYIDLYHIDSELGLYIFVQELCR